MPTGERRAEALRLYRTMRTIREFETTSVRLLKEGKLAGNLHLSIGQEAVAAGVCDVLREDDHITTTHRGHGHCVAKGGDVRRMFAELFGHQDGYCKGKAGSMHIADPRRGILGATAIVGGGYAMAVGAAFSAQVRGTDQVGVAFFGEGAVAQGGFHEALNIAALWRLPVLFVCENNQYVEMLHVREHIRAEIRRLAEPHELPGVAVDGNDVLAVRDAAEQAVARARGGGGPTLLECRTYRIGGHWEGDRQKYREAAEVEHWRALDPLLRLRERFPERAAEWDRVDVEVARLVHEAAALAERGTPASVDSLLEDVYAAPVGRWG
jgi:TPP-dependent pyruvate/acetoin dehydrogenase alpha subunit